MRAGGAEPCITTSASGPALSAPTSCTGALPHAQAVDIWNASAEIADSFANDGIRTADDLSDGEIRDAVADWQMMRELGL